mgnify:CR=1 FL=1
MPMRRHPFGRLLRARRERPRSRRAAEQRDELAPLHSITSSARGEQRRRNVEVRALLAVLRLMTSSNLVACIDRQVRRLRALEDATGIDADLAIRVSGVVPIADQAAGHREVSRCQ